MRSLTQRLVVVVLLSELLLTIMVTAINLGYEHSQRYKAFDVMLRGRAASVLSAVEIEEQDEKLILITKFIDQPKEGLYEVHTDSGRQLGHSSNWSGLPSGVTEKIGPIGKFRIHDTKYRYVFAHGFRTLDPDNAPQQTVGITAFYAFPTTSVREALQRAAEFLIGVNFLVLAISGLIAAALVRRGMAPLQELAVAAGSITATSWTFDPPPSARSLQELSGLVRALETTLQGLERSFQQQQHFIHDAAHELKTAVTIIKSSLQLLIYRPRTAEEYRSGIETSLNDSGRMEELVHKMLTLAHVEQQAATGQIAAINRINAGETILQVIENLRPVAELRSVQIVEQLSPDLITPLNSDLWNTLATNLILNAIQHSLPGGKIVVASQATAYAVIFTVTDTGTGIPSENIPYIFDRFYRGDPSRARTTGGTGLGLAICKAIVDSCNGQISVDSRPGEGTKFSVTFPINS